MSLNTQHMSLSMISEFLPDAQWMNMPSSDQAIKRFNSDSRQVMAGDLFIALRGEKFDAHDFLNDVQAKGAMACLVSSIEKLPQDFPAIMVEDTQQALQTLSSKWKQYCGQHKLRQVVIVTGSNGKTTVKGMIQSIFEAAVGTDKALATQGNFNNEIGLPLTLLRLDMNHELAVIELGMNHPGETALLANIAKPSIALINNAQREHQEFMETVDAVAQEHALAIEALPENGVAVYPADSEYSSYWKKIANQRTVIDFAFKQTATVWGEWLDQASGQMVIHTPQGDIKVMLKILGDHNACNAVAASAVAIAAGISPAMIQKGLESFMPVNGRMQKYSLKNDITVIDDSYNANPDSVRAAIDVLSNIKTTAWLVLGDMGEVGNQGPEFHREVGHYAGEKGIQKLFALGDLSKEAVLAYQASATQGNVAQHFADVTELCTELNKSLHARKNHEEVTLLVKGSRFMRMERVVKALAEEMH
jgi:UDP-N-acetylmuramoyl-tripeptide--D-alanyl-D-alanine ligase